MLKKIAVAVAAFALMCFAKDSFLTSCQKKWNANVENVKSFRADMVQTMTFDGKSSGNQLLKVMYLNLDKAYLRMNADVAATKMVTICHGDSMFVKIDANEWTQSQGKCSANPLVGIYESLGKSKLTFVKESNGIRVYRDSLKIEYKVQTKTCRVLEANNDEMRTTWEYESRDNIDVPVKSAMEIKKNPVTIRYELQGLLINQGVTKSFFEVK